MKTLVIIAGVAGEIGKAFAEKLIENKIETIGVVRNRKVEGIDSSLFRMISCHLDDSKSIEHSFKSVSFEPYERIIYLHTIGTDRFDPRNYPNITKMETIAPDIYDSNVNTFKYLLRYISDRINKSQKKILMKTAIIAGVPDKYTPFVIEPFCEAKLLLRAYIRSYEERYPEWFSGLSINITSTITKSALKVRPYADLQNWLTPENVVEESFLTLISEASSYEEKDIIKFSESFVEDYYENDGMLYEKWSKETGIYQTSDMKTKTRM